MSARPGGTIGVSVLNVWHVSTDDGATYGIAATGKRDALLSLQARLSAEHSAAQPVTVTRVPGHAYGWEYGTVLRYT